MNRFAFRLALAGLAAAPVPAAAQDRAADVGPSLQPGPAIPAAGPARQLAGVVFLRPATDNSAAGAVIVEEAVRSTRLTLRNDVLFDAGTAKFRPVAAEVLAQVMEFIHRHKPRRILIVGHTDSIGPESSKQNLSQQRARSVHEWLAAQGGNLPPAEVVGRGGREPVARNTRPDGRDDLEGRQRNRRVEILLER